MGQLIHSARENSKVHMLTDFSSVINFHHLSRETEKCHSDFQNMHNEEFILNRRHLPAEGVWRSSFHLFVVKADLSQSETGSRN